MPHGIGHLPSTIIKQGKEKAKKEAANKKKVVENTKKVEANKKKVAENKAKVRINKADIELAKFYKKIPKSQTYLKSGGSVKKEEKSGATDKNWIQKAVNPKHKGYCTPMTKPTCTPKRKALAKTFKAMAKKR
jgi:CxxC motif-containing protein